MSTPLELLEQIQTTAFYEEDGDPLKIKILPPISESELKALESKVPAPIPPDVMELLKTSKGLEGLLECVDFTGELGFEMLDLFPSGLPIAYDGFGNYWVVDLTSKSTQWGPIFFCCHDAPVIVYQASSLGEFMEDLIEFGTDFKNSRLNKVHEDYHYKVWKENPNVLTYEECINSIDPALAEFASSLTPRYLFIDLRNPKIGDGLSWGRFGAKTILKRYGEERIFAYERKSFFERILRK